MKRRQDEDLMRQQDLIDKQKEQTRYKFIFRVLHDLIDIFIHIQAQQRSPRLQVRGRQRQGRK